MFVFEWPKTFANTSIGIPYSTAKQANVWRATWVVKGLIYIADRRDFLQIGIHLRVRRHGKQLASHPTRFIPLVFLQQRDRMRKQRNAAHHRRLLTRLVDPLHAVLIGTDMFGFQVIRIREGQPRSSGTAPFPATRSVSHRG